MKEPCVCVCNILTLLANRVKRKNGFSEAKKARFSKKYKKLRKEFMGWSDDENKMYYVLE